MTEQPLHSDHAEVSHPGGTAEEESVRKENLLNWDEIFQNIQKMQTNFTFPFLNNLRNAPGINEMKDKLFNQIQNNPSTNVCVQATS